jgi:hypothetical protein
VVLDRRAALRGIGVAQRAESVAHDEKNRDAFVLTAYMQIVQVLRVLHLITEERVDQFDRFDALFPPRDARKIERRHLSREERPVE